MTCVGQSGHPTKVGEGDGDPHMVPGHEELSVATPGKGRNPTFKPRGAESTTFCVAEAEDGSAVSCSQWLL